MVETANVYSTKLKELPDDFGVVNGISPIFGFNETYHFNGSRHSHFDIENTQDLMIKNGTYSVKFNADTTNNIMAIFSKDSNGYNGGGDLNVYIRYDKLYVRMQTHNSPKFAIIDESIKANTDYHLAITFGDEGLKVYLNGKLSAALPALRQTMDANSENIVIGASGFKRVTNNDAPRLAFKGEISDFALYDKDLTAHEIAQLVGGHHQMNLEYELEVEDFMPNFTQLHHGSEYLKDIASDAGYGHGGHGHSHDDNHGSSMNMKKDIVKGDASDNNINGTHHTDYINGKAGNDTINGGNGNDQLQGHYGNDDLFGGEGNDILDGGHGEDVLVGGNGDDFLISRSDAREPFVKYNPNRDEGDPYNELDPKTKKLYPDQPLHADDVLTGGSGADTFYFQTLINSKERYMEKHTNKDGMIRWHGVAGENDKIHDHWVDGIGNDTITDFDRSEGDKIVIEGHTTKVLKVKYHDSDNDGILDYSKIHLYSDQGGNGGAHNDDRLGTITVYGDIVKDSDIKIDAKPAYGIVKNIDALEEAIKPLSNGSDRDHQFNAESSIPNNFGVVNGKAPVYGIHGKYHFTGGRDSYLELDHNEKLEIPSGTYSMNFNPDNVDRVRAIFAKEANGMGDGGHLQAHIKEGKLIVIMASDNYTRFVNTQYNIEKGKDYHLAISFGEKGLNIYVNGKHIIHQPGFQQSMEMNLENIVIGASGHKRTNSDQYPNLTYMGDVSNFTVYDTALSIDDINKLYNLEYDIISSDLDTDTDDDSNSGSDTDTDTDYSSTEDQYNKDIITGSINSDKIKGSEENDTIYGNEGDDLIIGREGGDFLSGDSGNDLLKGKSGNDTIYGGEGSDYIKGNSNDDSIMGGSESDTIYGGKGNDTINGGIGDDILEGNSGKDIFIFAITDGNDTITDFSKKNDQLIFSDNIFSNSEDALNSVIYNDSGAIITIDSSNSISLTGLNNGDLTEENFDVIS